MDYKLLIPAVTEISSSRLIHKFRVFSLGNAEIRTRRATTSQRPGLSREFGHGLETNVDSAEKIFFPIDTVLPRSGQNCNEKGKLIQKTDITKIAIYN